VREKLNAYKNAYLNTNARYWNLRQNPTDLEVLLRAVPRKDYPLLIQALSFPEIKATINTPDPFLGGMTPLMKSFNIDKGIAIELLNQGANPLIMAGREGVADYLRISTLPMRDKIEIRDKILDVVFKQPGRDVSNLLASSKTPLPQLPESAVSRIGTMLTGVKGTLVEQKEKLRTQLNRIGGKSRRRMRKTKRRYTNRR